MKRKAAERDRVLEAAWIFLAVIVLGLVTVDAKLAEAPARSASGGDASQSGPTGALSAHCAKLAE